MITIENSPNFSHDYKELAWEVFFRSKGRGISLQRHFPWLYKVSPEIQSFEALESGCVIGGLALKAMNCSIEGANYKVGLIGLVCVNPVSRGHGVAKQLLTNAIEYAKFNDFDYLTLWTSQHKIYSGLGFEVFDRWNYGSVERSWAVSARATNRHDKYPGTEDMKKSLPPFATARFELKNDLESITFVGDENGLIVTDYEGEPRLVAKVLFNQFPEKWRLNFVESDPLVNELSNLGMKIDTKPSNLQMWLPLNQRDPGAQVPSSMLISVLDRV
ncbi:GNAT family N-acetyltransferase [Undibacterium sp. SXout11W]|uniref:GNAT family N-acetyltransferase n=1 Tax=Undibacterium sp. SXout11W TaxID=3413050 RepID=UPI003BF0EC13